METTSRAVAAYTMLVSRKTTTWDDADWQSILYCQHVRIRPVCLQPRDVPARGVHARSCYAREFHGKPSQSRN